jgi:hypothetical protein
MEDTIQHLHQCSRGEANQHGQYGQEAWKVRVILALIYSAAGDYEHVVSLLSGYMVVEKGKSELNPMWMLWTVTLLVHAYFDLGRFSEAMGISEQGKPLAKGIDPSAPDLLLEELLEEATALEAKGDLTSRQRGVVIALMALCWSISHGVQRTPFGSDFLERLRVFFHSYGIRGDEWEWTVKHAHLTRYDFVGLLSILLHHTGLAFRPLSVVVKRPRRPRIIEVR